MSGFKEWVKSYLKCEWEDYEGNLNDSSMEAAYNAGMAEVQELADNNYASMKYHSDNFNGLLQQHRKLEDRFIKARELATTLQRQMDEFSQIAEQSQFGWQAADRMRRLQNNELI